MGLLKLFRPRHGRLHVILKELSTRQASSNTSGKHHTNRKFNRVENLKANILRNEVLYGRSVCKIALKGSRRPVFKLHLLKFWENVEPDDSRILESISLAKARGIPFSYLTRSRLDELSLHRPHQGICLEVGELPYYRMDENTCKSILDATPQHRTTQLWVLLCGILDPMNMGAILRSCLYFGVDNIAVTGDCAPITPIVSKASSGAAEILQIHSIDKPTGILQVLLNRGWEVIGTVPDFRDGMNSANAIEDISDVKIDKPSIILFGSEGSGLPNVLLEKCTKLVTITSQDNTGEDSSYTELRELVGSLNVSTATAIILHGLQKKTF